MVRSMGSGRKLQLREHACDELAHYAKACTDIEYEFPFGWSELEGIANRTDFDLRQHAEHSGRDLTYFDEQAQERYFPYVIEPSAGADRATLAFLVDAYHEEEVRKEKRVVLRFHKALAPIKAAVMPLKRNEPRIVAVAKELADNLRKCMSAVYDDTGSIGRLYRRQDEIGTVWCLTVDFQALEDQTVTVRDRDTMEQIRLPIAEVPARLKEQLDNAC